MRFRNGGRYGRSEVEGAPNYSNNSARCGVEVICHSVGVEVVCHSVGVEVIYHSVVVKVICHSIFRSGYRF